MRRAEERAISIWISARLPGEAFCTEARTETGLESEYHGPRSALCLTWESPPAPQTQTPRLGIDAPISPTPTSPSLAFSRVARVYPLYTPVAAHFILSGIIVPVLPSQTPSYQARCSARLTTATFKRILYDLFPDLGTVPDFQGKSDSPLNISVALSPTFVLV